MYFYIMLLPGSDVLHTDSENILQRENSVTVVLPVHVLIFMSEAEWNEMRVVRLG
jgi:hypothetical protein